MRFDMQYRNKLLAFVLVLTANLYFLERVYAQEACGPLNIQGQFGPFDYTSEEGRANLAVVENFHFGREVQNLRPGGSTTGADIDYTLRAFPNHHRALDRMVEFSMRTKSIKPPGAQYNLPCYFDRALRFKPDDGIVHMLFAGYLVKTGKPQEALEKYKEALRLRPEDANVNYNAGLLYFNLKNYDLAYQHAKKAYELGFPLPGLKTKLQQAGKWRE